MMQSKVVLHIRDPFLLDASTYVSAAVMALLGISGLQNLTLQIAALALCLIFALLYRFLFRTGYYERNPSVYFGAQAVVMTMLFLLNSSSSDAFNFLMYILTVHATVVLSIRTAVFWVSLYFVIAAAASLISAGVDGLYAVFFYLAAFVICAILGRTVQQTELTSERNQRLVDELKETQQKLQELAVVDERNRLARDLHDSVKQQVFAISMQLGAARALLDNGHQAYGPVEEAERLAKQAGAELTTLIRELRPPGLESKSLAGALQDYVAEWSRQNGIAADLKVDASSIALPEAETLFRVTQEALANVARHSQAGNVTVELAREDNEIILTVEDDGAGFDMGRVEKGVGLDSMRERLEAIGGQLEISSQRSSGTRVMARVRRA
jgi:signal transduction histidine kinase